MPLPLDREDAENEAIASVVRAFLADQQPERKDAITTLDPKASLFEEGLIDSLTFVELIELLEDTYEFEVPAQDFLPDNFWSLDRIILYVRSHRVDQSGLARV